MKRMDIISKLEKGKKLTRKEDIFYLTRMIGFPLHQARVIFAIAGNKNPNLIIDWEFSSIHGQTGKCDR